MRWTVEGLPGVLIILLDKNDVPTDESVISIEGICYIDEGVLIQGTDNTSESIENWSATGNYIWTNNLDWSRRW